MTHVFSRPAADQRGSAVGRHAVRAGRDVYGKLCCPFLGVAFVFGVVNATIRPVAKILTFPLIILTLGLFALVVNGLMLWLTSTLSAALGLGFHVDGFWAAFWGALVVSIVSTILSMFVTDSFRWRYDRRDI